MFVWYGCSARHPYGPCRAPFVCPAEHPFHTCNISCHEMPASCVASVTWRQLHGLCQKLCKQYLSHSYHRTYEKLGAKSHATGLANCYYIFHIAWTHFQLLRSVAGQGGCLLLMPHAINVWRTAPDVDRGKNTTQSPGHALVNSTVKQFEVQSCL